MARSKDEYEKNHAEALWGSFRASFLEAEALLKEIIVQRAWEPLGYSTFAEAWKARMSDVTIAVEIRPHVVYQMLAEGISVDDVADSVKGVGPDTAKGLDRQRRNGVPADFAVVRRHFRKPPSPADTLHIKVGKTWLTEYQRIAKKLDESVEDIAKRAIADRFKELAGQVKRSA